ncbi:filamentous hemagglutinin N-terminal domain-containing protein [Candidatus Parabeggiatoa sp. HSG14]|uniref:filamentous hemagglutinin N-terminal domain-containing protein n=1 Tax=Candidatus Parabeggiatoa sp. HSG14 TaxID=3055593 RepID=UPI0025A7ECBC|nr:filamentous hemagglutinin N-terminal domain-containing protein [Thiotrichales bacterium HSG14]
MSKNFLISFFAILCIPLHAQIMTDGTLGTHGTLNGPNYAIGAELGQQHGGNLFHSFETFNINTNESATFSGPNSVSNIISRVTGGNPSHIDGLLSSTIPNADVYFLNPYGIMFGPNAALDVQGSFHASTADTLRFQDGSEFNARLPNNALLTVASPEAFGFLTHSPAPLSIEGSQISVPAEKTLSIISGGIKISQAEITAPFGRLNFASVASIGDVIPRYEDLPAAKPLGGDIAIHNSYVSTSGEGGGEIYIRGGRFELHNTLVEASTYGTMDGKGINVQTNELIATEGGRFTAHTFSSGKGGEIKINVVGTAEFSGVNSEDESSGLFAYSKSEDDNAGNAGNIVLEVGELKLMDGAGIASETVGSGQGGNVTIEVNAGKMILDEAWIFDATFGIGKGGNVVIRVKAGQLIILNGTQVAASTFGSGKGGNVDIKVAEGVIVSGGYGEDFPSGIFSSSEASSEDNIEGGDAGTITLEAKELSITDGAEIGTTTWGTGKGGSITLRINGLATLNESSIKSNAEGVAENAGNGGMITIEAKRLSIINGGQIGAATFGPGDGGKIHVKVRENVELSGTDREGFPSGIFANAEGFDNLGKAGEIILETDGLLIAEGAEIAVSSDGSNLGGDVKIQARYIRLSDNGLITAYSTEQGNAGNVVLTVGEKLEMQNSVIETAAERADGGDIRISSPGYLYLIGSRITTSVQAEKGDGGNITLKPEFMVLDGSQIIARAVGGKGGNINITTTGIYAFSESPIDASSQLGVDGVVDIDSPDVNVEAALVILSAAFFDASNLLKPSCGQTRALEQVNHFVVTPFAGSPPSPYDWKTNRLVSKSFEKQTNTMTSIPRFDKSYQPTGIGVIKVVCAK